MRLALIIIGGLVAAAGIAMLVIGVSMQRWLKR